MPGIVAVSRGGLLHRLFTLTRRKERAVCFLRHFPSPLGARLLTGALSCEARTFLPGGEPPERLPDRLAASSIFYYRFIGKTVRNGVFFPSDVRYEDLFEKFFRLFCLLKKGNNVRVSDFPFSVHLVCQQK